MSDRSAYYKEYDAKRDRKEYHKTYNATRDRKAYDAARENRKTSSRFPLNEKGEFVTVDSEGQSYGPIDEVGGRKYRAHKTFLWMAGNHRDQAILKDANNLRSNQILEFLAVDLPARFPKAIFVSYVFSYDATQVVADWPYEKVWEICKGRPWEDKGKKGVCKNTERWVLHGNYAVKYKKGKEFSVAKLKPGPAFIIKNNKKYLNIASQIRVYDVFGFFQSSFLKALDEMPGSLTPEEKEIVEKGKAARSQFSSDMMDEIITYTKAELAGCSRMMDTLRKAMQDLDIRLSRWFGAGSIAGAVLNKYKVPEHYWPVAATVEKAPPYQMAAHHAYFGGRAELLMQGFTKQRIYNYDISSAYPYELTKLPTMKGGEWVYHKEPTREQVAKMSPLSIIKLKTHAPGERYVRGVDYMGYSDEGHEKTNDKPHARFYPFPYRTKRGSIIFYKEVWGWYMQAEVSAAFHYSETAAPPDFSIELEEAWEFIPASDERPFAFIAELFDTRAEIIKKDKTDIRGKVLKLGMNSCYGKIAERLMSGFDKVPKLANPWYAAAITAGTRAMILRAMCSNPDAIIMAATDGLDTIAPLEIDAKNDGKKILGGWEFEEIPHGGLYVHSGVYMQSSEPGKYKIKTRGVRVTNAGVKLQDYLVEKIPPLWDKKVKDFDLPYKAYATMGYAISSRENFKTIGQWFETVRTLKIDKAGTKRMAPNCRLTNAAMARSRAKKLVYTIPMDKSQDFIDSTADWIHLSEIYKPEWLTSEESALDRELQVDLNELYCKHN